MLNFRGVSSFWPDLIRSGCAEDGGGETLLAPVKLDNAASWDAGTASDHFCLEGKKLHLSTITRWWFHICFYVYPYFSTGNISVFEGRNMFFFVGGNCLYTGIFKISQLTSFLVGVDLHHFMGEIFKNSGSCGS